MIAQDYQIYGKHNLSWAAGTGTDASNIEAWAAAVDSAHDTLGFAMGLIYTQWDFSDADLHGLLVCADRAWNHRGVCNYTRAPSAPLPRLKSDDQKWPWKYGGFESFPSWWGPAGRKDGPDTESYQSLIAKHQVSGWGWQQGVDGSCAMAGEEQCELNSLGQLRNWSAAVPGRPFPEAVYVYRNIDAAGREFSELHDAIEHHPEWFVHNQEGLPCWIKGGNQHGNPTWNLSIPAARDYFVDRVIGEAAKEPHGQGVFLDGADGTDCDSTYTFVQGWQKAFSNCTNASGGAFSMTRADRDAQARGKLELLKRSVAMLAAAGKVAIINTARVFSPGNGAAGCTSTGTGLDCTCTLRYEDYVEAFAPHPWVRFYEVWNSTTHLRNALAEAKQDIAHVVHAGYVPPAPPPPAPFPTSGKISNDLSRCPSR